MAKVGDYNLFTGRRLTQEDIDRQNAAIAQLAVTNPDIDLAAILDSMSGPQSPLAQASAAYKAYDSLSKRELQVFKLRCKLITFPLIAEQLDISTSSAKTYWRRSLAKCMALWESSDPLIDEEE